MTQENPGRPPVDPLSDVAWARVERGLWARLDGAGTVTSAATSREITREKRSWSWLAIPLAAAAACALVMFATRGAPSAVPAAEPEPARVVSGASPSAVSFGDAHVELAADTAVNMVYDGEQPVAQLERGAAWFEVAPRGDRPPFEVRAGDAIVRVIGTRFRVARDGEHVEVSVAHGVVEIRFRGRVMRLSKGQAWGSDQPDAVKGGPR